MTVIAELNPTTHIEVLDQVARGAQLPGISERLNLDIRIVRTLASEAGAPDLGAVRNHLHRLRHATRPAPRAAPVDLEADSPALAVIRRLSAAARDRDADTIGALINGFDLTGRAELIVTMAAIITPDVDLAAALEWVDFPAEAWSQRTVKREDRRWAAGARDKTAVAAHKRATR